MADPNKLYRHLPDAFDRSPKSDQYRLLAGLSRATEDGREEVADLQADLTLATADGVGLDRYGENFSTPRPPGLLDVHHRKAIAVIAGGRRGTVAIIKAVLEAATEVTWIVKDRQLDVVQNSGGWGIPAFEVWAQKESAFSDPFGQAYAGYDTHIDGHPVESGLAGPVLDFLGKDGGRHNDHVYAPLDLWTMAMVERVRPAGTRVVYKEFY